MSDSYSRLDYRRLIAWPARIEREWPLLDRVLSAGPSRRVLDLGCGTGEHARFLVDRGFEIVGVDASESMLEQALDLPVPAGLTFIGGSITELQELTEGAFGGAICLGNTLPHLRTEGELVAFAEGLRRVLLPGSSLLLQLINYERVLATGQRHLPLNFRAGDGEETIFLRLMTPGEDGTVLFFPTSLCLRPDRDPPVEIVSSRQVELHGWTHPEVVEAFSQVGFRRFDAYGAFDASPYRPLDSPDLILAAS